MSHHNELVTQTARVIARQLAGVGLAAGSAAYWGWPAVTKGLAYGGGLAAVLAIMLSASLQRAAETGHRRGAAILYRGAVERFLLVAGAVILAATALDLHVGAVVGGLIIAHVITFFEAIRLYGPRSKIHDSGIGEKR